MNSDRIKEIQSKTAYPESVSVMQALEQVWNETAQESSKRIKELEDAMKTFVRRCEEGSIISRKTYGQFKRLLDE